MSEQGQKSWFGRNWLWFIPLTGCLGFILLIVLGLGAAFFGVSNMINNATPVEYAIELAAKNELVIKNLGEPIEKYGIPSGNISLTNDDGDVDFSIPIRGNIGEGTLVVRGIKIDGEWVYEDLYVRIRDTQEEINLLEKEKILESI
ncbi:MULTISPECIES: cytochrome c oxidase assembly factor Coa1 family protein [unclassified Tenacibaculum]|uniref:cytochrome c oxidase assembly factor Coa1 family protein n=1 Tax=unclassified Tenacibaculum TaxID=2635139 RepID=UPI00237C050F|nr:cytochrome c oxidase assembly factor Coa1 family protein [Tenacibaculum sp. L6]MDE0535243.1 cytochrome c oxidase assembly factor Coa1 family protein [Tenacibaculum sp. L6]